MGDKSPCSQTVRIKNQFKFAKHNTPYNVQLQYGKIIEVNAGMGAAAREFSCVDATTDGYSYSVEESLVTFRKVTPQMLRCISQKTWRHTSFSVQYKGAHKDPLDMEPRIRSVIRLIMTYYAYTLLSVL